MRRRSPGWVDAIGLTYYPSFDFARLPDPVGERAVDQHGIQVALRRRALVRLRIVGIAAVGVAGALVAAVSTSWNAGVDWMVVAASGVLLGGVVSVGRIEVLRRRLTFLQNLRRGHYELAIDVPPALRVAAAFTELARAI